MSLAVLSLVSLLGLAVGSFLNVVILRSIENKSIKGRSVCPHCHHQLKAFDLVPIFSYLYLRGKCRYCQKKISIQYPLVEAVTLLAYLVTSLLILALFNQTINIHSFFVIVTYLFGISVLIATFVTDIRFGLIPNRIIIPGIIVLLILKLAYLATVIGTTYFNFLYDPEGLGKYLLPPYSTYIFTILSRYALTLAYDLLAGLGIGLAFYLLVVFTKGRAMGGGDIKLGVFIGVLNGWPLSLVTLLLAFVSGAMVSVGLLLVRKKKFGQTIPFGPFLAASSIVTLFWGQRIFDWYVNLLG